MIADDDAFDRAFLGGVASRIINAMPQPEPGDVRHHEQAAREDRVEAASHHSRDRWDQKEDISQRFS